MGVRKPSDKSALKGNVNRITTPKIIVAIPKIAEPSIIPS
jgi:hypothetical protein